MRKRVKIALAGLLVAVGGVIAGVLMWEVLHPQEREPVYQGTPLSVWLTPRSYNGDMEAWQAQAHKAHEAVLQIGTNALPTLLRMLRAKDSALKVRFMGLVMRQHIIKIRYAPAEEWNRRARRGFEVLGARAKSAVPTLIDIADRNISRTSRLATIDALGFIGAPAEEAVPSLLGWATNADPELRCDAIFTLGKIRSQPDRVVPELTNALHDPTPMVRIYAFIALEHFGPDAKLAVPALVEFLKTDSTTRSRSALNAIDPAAAAKPRLK
jgi:HEAT repeat protein